MLDGQKYQVHSVEELIQALHPVQASAIFSDRVEMALPELRQMKNNISAVLSFVSFSLGDETLQNPEFRRAIEDVRRECLMINGVISRIIFRQRWLFSLSKVENARDVLAKYERMATATYRMCQISAPELGVNLLGAF